MEAVTYNPKTHRLEWGTSKFLSVTRPWWLSQEEADRALASLLVQLKEGVNVESAG